MSARYCNCAKPLPTPHATGREVCQRCGELVEDRREVARDAAIAGIARALATIERRQPDGNGDGSLAIAAPPELIEAIAERAAEIVLERSGPEPTTDGWLRGASAIAAYIGAPASRVYALGNCKPSRIPVHRDGSALIAKRSELDAWMRSGGGKRP